MREAVFAGLLAGYAIAIPVGAIAVLIIHTALTHGLRTGMAAAAGIRGLVLLRSARESIEPMAAHNLARRPHHRT